MKRTFSHKVASLLHELDLGQHTLFIMSDGSIDLLDNDEETPYLAENGLHLDSEETYRLFISLHEQWKQKKCSSIEAIEQGHEEEPYTYVRSCTSPKVIRQREGAPQ